MQINHTYMYLFIHSLIFIYVFLISFLSYLYTQYSDVDETWMYYDVYIGVCVFRDLCELFWLSICAWTRYGNLLPIIALGFSKIAQTQITNMWLVKFPTKKQTQYCL